MAHKGKRICATDDSDEKPDSITFKYLLEPDSTIIQMLKAYKSAAATSSAVKSAKLYLDDAYVACVDIGIGVVVGKLSFSEDGYTIDCTKRGSGVGIPRNIDQVGNMKSEALSILLVEKHATYMRLVEEKFYNRFLCIIVRARQPDVAALQFLRKMKVELKLPVLALVDSNPFGVYILSVYDRSMSDIKWLGVRPSDPINYKIPDYCRLPMMEKDIKYMKDLLKRGL
ncbi:DNA topoisomerase 6 subunit A [Orobanche hederae]